MCPFSRILKANIGAHPTILWYCIWQGTEVQVLSFKTQYSYRILHSARVGNSELPRFAWSTSCSRCSNVILREHRPRFCGIRVIRVVARNLTMQRILHQPRRRIHSVTAYDTKIDSAITLTATTVAIGGCVNIRWGKACRTATRRVEIPAWLYGLWRDWHRWQHQTQWGSSKICTAHWFGN